MTRDLLLFTSDFDAAKAEVESMGGAVTQQFGRCVFVARIPEDLAVDSLTMAGTEMPEGLDDASRLAVDAWKNKGEKFDDSEANKHEGRKWDAPGYEPP